MAENSKEKTIKEIAKNSLEKVIISLREYRGKKLIDVRTYYQDNTSKWQPTRKGISLDIGKFDDLKSGILELEKAIKDF